MIFKTLKKKLIRSNYAYETATVEADIEYEMITELKRILICNEDCYQTNILNLVYRISRLPSTLHPHSSLFQ